MHMTCQGRCFSFKPQWRQASNFSLQYPCLVKRTGHENQGNDHKHEMS